MTEIRKTGRVAFVISNSGAEANFNGSRGIGNERDADDNRRKTITHEMRQGQPGRDREGCKQAGLKAYNPVNESHQNWGLEKTVSFSMCRLPLPNGTDPKARPSPTGATARLSCLSPNFSCTLPVHRQSARLPIAAQTQSSASNQSMPQLAQNITGLILLL